jgi:hypothetical protein
MVAIRTLMPLIASCGYTKMWITNTYDSSHCFTIKGKGRKEKSDDGRVDK